MTTKLSIKTSEISKPIIYDCKIMNVKIKVVINTVF